MDAFLSNTTSELMEGILRRGKFASLSAVTIGGADDIFGYEVDYSAADPYPITVSTNRLGGPTIDEGILTTIDLDLSTVIEDVVPVGLQPWGAIVDGPQI